MEILKFVDIIFLSVIYVDIIVDASDGARRAFVTANCDAVFCTNPKPLVEPTFYRRGRVLQHPGGFVILHFEVFFYSL